MSESKEFFVLRNLDSMSGLKFQTLIRFDFVCMVSRSGFYMLLRVEFIFFDLVLSIAVCW